MKKLLLAVLLCFAFVGLRAQTLDPNYIDGHLYFKFVDSYDFKFAVNEDTRIDPSEMKEYANLFAEYGVTLITRPLYAFNDPVTERIIRLEFTQYKRINQFIAALEALPEVEYAERVPLPHILVTYNDPYSTGSWGSAGPYQWNLTMINAQDAWAAQVASSSIKVAVVDNAVWGAHPDLQIASSNLCNYGSGYATTGNANPPSTVNQNETCNQNYFYYGSGSCDSYDWSHGTHCAGMVAAKNNNGIGISSIGGGDGSNGSGLTLMGVRAANNSGYLYYTSEGATWAANHGANVISMSYGGSSSSQSEARSYLNLYNNGVVLVAAAGNEGDADNYKSYPACYTGVISVASVDNNRKLSSFSQHGTGRADIAAPGGYYSSTGYNNILSTTYCKNQYNRIILGTALSGQYYDGMQGTSMACPTAAGLCGLMLSAYPDMTPDQVLTCLQDNEQPLAAGSNTIDGHGYIDAAASVNCAKALAAVLRANPSTVVIASRGGSKTVEVTAANNLSGNWTATCNNAAFTISPTSGAGSGATTTMTVTAAANSTGAPIEGTITITQGTGSNRQSVTISVHQNDQSDFCGTLGEELFNDDSIGFHWTSQYDYETNGLLYAQKFPNSRVGTVDSITLAGYFVSASAGYLKISIYDDNNGVPGTELASKNITMATFRAATSNIYTQQTPNIYIGDVFGIKLDSPVEVSGNYYVGFDFSGVTAVTGYYDCVVLDVLDNAATQDTLNNGYVKYNGNWYKGDRLLGDYYDIAVSSHFCESTNPWLTVNPESITANPLMGSEEIAISANCDWTATSSCDWVYVSPASGTDMSTATLSIAENMGEERNCTVTFTYEGGGTVVIPISQMAHQSGCNDAELFDWQHFGWRVNDAQTAYQLDQDSLYYTYAIPLDDDNTVDTGYMYGNNRYYDLTAAANLIEVYGSAVVNSVNYIYGTTGTGGNVTFKIWDAQKNVLASKTVTMSSLSSGNIYEWELDTPLEVTDSIYVGADFSGVTTGSFFYFYTNLFYANMSNEDALNAGYIVQNYQGDDYWIDYYGTIDAFPSICYNGGHLNIDLSLTQVDSDTNVITTATLNAGDSLSASYILGNFGEAPYVDTTKVYIKIDTLDLGNFFYPPMNFFAGGALVDGIDILSWDEVRALGYHHNDVLNLCLRVEQTNTTYDWVDMDMTNNESCVAFTINCPPVQNNMTQTACESYTLSGTTYTESGIYSDTLTAANGCDSIVSLNLTINHGTHNAETVSECDSYTWHEGNYALSGNYTYSYTNANNCPSVDTLHLTITQTPVITVDGNLTINPGQTTTLTASGATTYVWKNNGATVSTSNPFTTPTLNSTTVYTVEGTTNSCTSMTSVTVTVQAAQPTNGDTTVVACGSFTWGRTGINYTSSQEPTYTIVGGNAQGADSIITLHLTINQLPTITVNGNNSIYTGQATTLTANGAATYVWATGGAEVSTNNPYTTPALNNTTTYTVTGTDANNCSNSTTYTVSVTAAPSTNGDTTVVACGSFTWGRTGISYTSSQEPTYTIVGGNHLGGDSIITLHLTINPLPTITVSGNNSIYTGQTTTLTANGAATYVWATGGAEVSTNNPYTTPALNNTTTYTVTGTDANNCSNSTTYTVSVTAAPSTNGDTTVVACGSFTWDRTGIAYTSSQEPTYTIVGGNHLGGDSIITLHLTINPLPTITVSGNNSIYTGQTTTLTANGAATYVWATGGAEVSSDNPYTTPALNNTTTYTVTGTDANNCSNSTTYTVSVTAAPSTNGDTTVVACGSFTWGRTGIAYTSSQEPIYTIIGGNHLGGDSIITLHLTINPLPTITVSGNNSIYTGQTTTLTANGAATYVWATGGAEVSTNNPYTTPALNNTTTYTVTGTDANNCSNSTTYTVSVTAAPTTNGDTTVVACGSFTWGRTGISYTSSQEPTYTIVGGNHLGGDSIITLHLTINPNPTITVDGNTTITSGESTTLTASGAVDYEWTLSGSTVSTAATYVASPATNTTYNVTGTDANGCSGSTTVTVVVSSPSTVYDTVAVEACASYEWNGHTYTESGFYQYAEGYNVHVLNLTINPNPTITVNGNTSIYIGQSTTLTATGAATYVWATGGADVSTDNPYTTPALNNTTTYTVTGTDANTCIGTTQVTVTVSQAATTTGDTNAVACASYTWRGNTYTSSGDYTYTIVGGNYLGGDSIITLHLTINPNPTISVDGNTSIYIGQSTTLTANGAATYVWATGGADVSTDNPYTTPALNNTTTYTVTGTDANTCIGTTQVTVTVSQAATTTGDTNAVACASYTWRGNTYTTSGDYTYTIVGGNYLGGDSIITLHLTINPNPTITVNGNTSIYTGQTTTLTASGAATYVWATGGAEVSANNPYTTPALNNTTTYTVTGTDANTCVGTTQVTVTVSQAGATNGDTNAVACASYTWRGNTYTSSGDYTYTIVGGNYLGGDSIITLHLTINPNPTITVNGNTSIYIGQSTTLTANGAATYVWATGGANVSSDNPYTTPALNNTTTYTVTGTDANTCVGTTQVTVTVSQAGATNGDTNAVACASYTWRGNTYTTSGDYTYTIVGGNYLGGDSIITLHLTINPNPTITVNGNTSIYIGQSTTLTVNGAATYVWATGGADVSTDNPYTTAALNNTTTYTVTGTDANTCVGTTQVTVLVSQAPQTTGDTIATACDSFTWYGQTYNISGNYTHVMTNYLGGDSIVTLHLTINNSTTAVEQHTACDSYTWHGVTYTESNNTATFTTTGSNGCDLVTTLNLTINNSTSNEMTATSCDTYFWPTNGMTYNTSGNYNYTTTGSNGCPNVTTLHLTINQSTTADASATACDTYTWPLNGQVYSTSGNYSYTTTGSNGCPQTTTLHLTVNYSTSSNVTEEACDVYNWNGTQYTQSGTYMVNQTNSVGCTEVVTLHLTINPSTTEADQQTACDSYRWPTNNQSYTTSGNYTYTTVNEWGCPRIITLNLTINYSSENNIYDTVSAGSAYSNYGFYVPGNQTGVAIPGDVIELSHTGFYTAQHCDSTVYLHLTVTESQGGGEGIDDANGIAMKLYPNPASVNVEIDCEGISVLRVYDMTGRMLNEQTNIVGNNAKVDVSNFAEGIYVFSITTQSGATAKQKVVVKH